MKDDWVLRSNIKSLVIESAVKELEHVQESKSEIHSRHFFLLFQLADPKYSCAIFAKMQIQIYFLEIFNNIYPIYGEQLLIFTLIANLEF